MLTSPRRPPERIAAWLVTGPVGHLVGGVADWLELVVRWQLGRAARRWRRRRR